MKKITLIITGFIVLNLIGFQRAKGQSIKVVPFPNQQIFFFGGFSNNTIYNNYLYGAVGGLDDQHLPQLAYFDGNNIQLIANPDANSQFPFSLAGVSTRHIFYKYF